MDIDEVIRTLDRNLQGMRQRLENQDPEDVGLWVDSAEINKLSGYAHAIRDLKEQVAIQRRKTVSWTHAAAPVKAG